MACAKRNAKLCVWSKAQSPKVLWWPRNALLTLLNFEKLRHPAHEGLSEIRSLCAAQRISQLVLL